MSQRSYTADHVRFIGGHYKSLKAFMRVNKSGSQVSCAKDTSLNLLKQLGGVPTAALINKRLRRNMVETRKRLY